MDVRPARDPTALITNYSNYITRFASNCRPTRRTVGADLSSLPHLPPRPAFFFADFWAAMQTTPENRVDQRKKTIALSQTRMAPGKRPTIVCFNIFSFLIYY